MIAPLVSVALFSAAGGAPQGVEIGTLPKDAAPGKRPYVTQYTVLALRPDGEVAVEGDVDAEIRPGGGTWRVAAEDLCRTPGGGIRLRVK